MTIKKLLFSISVICIFSVVFSINTYAYDDKQLLDSINLNEIINSLPESARANIPEELLAEDDITKIPSKIEPETLREYTLNLLQRTAKNILAPFYSLLLTVILISVLNTSKDTLAHESFQHGIEYISALALSVCTYEILTKTSTYITDFMKTLDILINSLIPIMATLYSIGGNVASAIVSTSGMSLTITATNYALQHIFLPSLKICFGLLLASRISGIKGVAQIESTLRKFLTTSLVGTTTLFSFFLVFKTNISVASDGLTARTIRFAGSFIPVVGSTLGESVRTVMTGISMIKSSVGFVGVFILLAITLPTLLQIVITKTSFDLASTVSAVLGSEKEGEFLKNVSSIFNFLIAVTFTICILFMFELTVFIFISPALGG